MNTNRKIIAFVDFLDHSDDTVRSAFSMAELLSADIHFIHVFDFYKDDPLLENVFVQRCEEQLFARATSRMTLLLAATNQTNTECTGEVVTGNAREICNRMKANNQKDLIITSLDTQ